MNRLTIILALLPLLLSCEREPFNASNEILYGTWVTQRYFSSGLYAGTSEVDEPGMSIKFEHPDHYSFLKENKEIENGRFEIIEQTSQDLVIKFILPKNPVTFDSSLSLYQTNLEISIFNNDSISISGEPNLHFFFIYYLSRE